MKKGWFTALLLILLYTTAGAVAKQDTAQRQVDNKHIDVILARSRRLLLKQPDLARVVAKEALVLSKKNNYKHGIGHSFNVIGVTYWAQSFLAVSQFYLTLAVPYLKDDNDALSSCYRSIARNYVELENYDKAKYYFAQAIKLVSPHNIAGKAQVYTELTSLYHGNGDYVTGLKYIDTALKYSRAVHNPNLVAILYNRLGQTYISLNKLDLAEKTLDTCYQITLTLRNKRLRSVNQIDQARLFVLKNDLAKATDYANKGYLLADTLGAMELKQRALRVLTGIYEKQGNLKQALATQQKANTLQQYVAILNNERSLELIQDYAALNTRLNRIEQISTNNTANEVLIHTQHRTIALLVASLMTAITFLVVIFIYYKQKIELNNQLQKQHEVLTQQKKLIELQRADLEEVNKLKDKLLAIIGHDLRTPIASMSSISDLFSIDYLSEDEVKKLMTDLTPIIKGAELTLSNLMEFANSQMKGHHVNSSSVDICAITNEMKQTFMHQLQQKNISVDNVCQEGVVVWADPNHIKVVLRNLISNAIKFTHNNGYIKVHTIAKNGMVEICVEDNGVGMTPAEIEKVLHAHQHFSQRGTSGETGTGLGLLLCKELIEMNKGNLRIEAISGQGCRFYFTLPTMVDTAVANAV